MCGIVGYVGKRRAAPLLYAGLKKLEYRGYDSAGIATLSSDMVWVKKVTGHVAGLRGAASLEGTCGIGHTRWATHGAPTEANAHPHVYGRFAIVHNGIIENFRSLRRMCEARGEEFSSETDSEVVAHLLERLYRGDLLDALRRTCSVLKGSYALAVICRDAPGAIALAREKSPLVIGRGKLGHFLASDIPALAPACGEICPLSDGEFALLTGEGVRLFTGEREIAPRWVPLARGEKETGKEGHAHYMEKEIAEIPAVLQRSRGGLGEGEAFSRVREAVIRADRIHIVACGTAYHAGLAAKYAIERLTRIPAEVTVASEYRYLDPILTDKTVLLAVSQSGETADTIAAARHAKERGARVVAIVNEIRSTLAALADERLPIGAGTEIAVAATKSYVAQLAVLYSLAASVAEAQGRRGYGDALAELPDLARETVRAGKAVAGWAAHFAAARSAYFIGRGADSVTALEGSLKLKEISYLPSEGYPAGELKHGTLALIEENTPVVAVLTSEELAEKTMNAVHEARARGAKVFLVTSLPAYADERGLTGSAVIPRCADVYSPALAVIPLQQLAYFVSLARGCDPDRPRNLAKSVTVE